MKRKGATNDSDAPENQRANEQRAQESEPAGKTEWLGPMSVEGPGVLAGGREWSKAHFKETSINKEREITETQNAEMEPAIFLKQTWLKKDRTN